MAVPNKLTTECTFRLSPSSGVCISFQQYKYCDLNPTPSDLNRFGSLVIIYLFCILPGKSVKNKFLFYNDSLPRPKPSLTRTTLGQMCAALWDSLSRPGVIQPVTKPGSVGMPLALRCTALDCCATREPKQVPVGATHGVHYIGVRSGNAPARPLAGQFT
jgi:hypothetical protein